MIITPEARLDAFNVQRFFGRGPFHFIRGPCVTKRALSSRRSAKRLFHVPHLLVTARRDVLHLQHREVRADRFTWQLQTGARSNKSTTFGAATTTTTTTTTSGIATEAFSLGRTRGNHLSHRTHDSRPPELSTRASSGVVFWDEVRGQSVGLELEKLYRLLPNFNFFDRVQKDSDGQRPRRPQSACCCCCVFYSLQYNIILYNIQNRKTEKVKVEAKICLYIHILNYQINPKMNIKSRKITNKIILYKYIHIHIYILYFI